MIRAKLKFYTFKHTRRVVFYKKYQIKSLITSSIEVIHTPIRLWYSTFVLLIYLITFTGLTRRQYDRVKLHMTAMNTQFLKSEVQEYNRKRETFDATNILNVKFHKKSSIKSLKTQNEKKQLHPLTINYVSDSSGHFLRQNAIFQCSSVPEAHQVKGRILPGNGENRIRRFLIVEFQLYTVNICT